MAITLNQLLKKSYHGELKCVAGHKGCLLYTSNTARGPIIDNVALAKALKDGKIAGAGIDVFDTEPPLAPDYPLLDAPNTVLMPHIGFSTKEALYKRAVITINNITSWKSGEPQNVV